MASVWLGQNEDICPSIKKSMYNHKSELCTIILQLICTPCFNFEILSCAFFILALYGNLTLSCMVWSETRATFKC
jgi:hypothetical protein